VYASVPHFCQRHRADDPLAKLSIHERIYRYRIHLRNSFLVTIPIFIKELVTGEFRNLHPTALSSLIPTLNVGSPLMAYLVLVAMVQSTLFLSDIFYWAGHKLQHERPGWHTATRHTYHHTWRRPSSYVGVWLSPMDLVISMTTTFALPIGIVVGVAQSCGFIIDDSSARFFGAFLMMYVHEMNHFDHAGKQVPVWSGSPLCPPLGFALGLHESIPLHEGHHNYSNCGYGLLGVADRAFGTATYPEGHPKHSKKVLVGA